MSNPYAEHTQAKAVARIAGALERIAEAAERQVAADPLAMLQELAEESVAATPQEAFASNGFIHLYTLPGTAEWQVVVRRDAGQVSGYSVAIERTG